MESLPYTVRNYQPQDFDRFLKLYIEAERLDPAGRPTSSAGLKEKFHHPNYVPERDLFIAEIDDEFVAYLDMLPEIGIGRVVLDCWVHPAHRGKRLVKALLRYGAQRGRELGADKAHINVQNQNTAARDVLHHLGFRHVRTFLELTLDLSGLPSEDVGAYGCRHLQRGEEKMLMDIQNRCFMGSWGYNPNTMETIDYRVNLAHCAPEDVILDYQGDRIAGYCWTEVPGESRAGANREKGRIYMMGTDPDFRGKGIGKRILMAGLSHLKRRGVRKCDLTVDAQNEEARRLYEDVGFHLQMVTLWYEVSIQPSAPSIQFPD